MSLEPGVGIRFDGNKSASEVQTGEIHLLLILISVSVYFIFSIRCGYNCTTKFLSVNLCCDADSFSRVLGIAFSIFLCLYLLLANMKLS